MNPHRKEAGDLVPADIEITPVWEFDLANEVDSETAVIPVFDLPVDDLSIRIVGTNVCLANGTRMWAGIQNIDPKSAMKTRHLLSLLLYSSGEWIFLARYHDPGQEGYGPAALARKLGLKLDDVFPISYDVSGCCIGDAAALAGVIESDPKDKLGQDEIFRLIVGEEPGA